MNSNVQAVDLNTTEEITTRHDVEARVAMIMLQLPFPPLPVVMINDNGDEKMGSSHDLLSRVLAVSIVTQTHSSLQQLETKAYILETLNKEIAVSWQKAVEAMMDERMCLAADADETTTKNMSAKIWRLVDVEPCYELYCQWFRAYMACYPGSPDLRMFPLYSVTQDDLPFTHAVEHLQAREVYILPENGTECVKAVPKVKKNVHSYSDLLRLYSWSMFHDSVLSSG